METETKPTPALKAAVKPTKSIDLANPVEIPKLAATKPPSNLAEDGAEKPLAPIAALANLLERTPKEHLPTMMVRIANKCLAEKVFATPGAMAEAIVGASKK